MRVEILLWAQMRLAAGTERIEMELPGGARLADALDALYRLHPVLAAHRATARAAVGDEYADADVMLHDGDEISLIPPVQGG